MLLQHRAATVGPLHTGPATSDYLSYRRLTGGSRPTTVRAGVPSNGGSGMLRTSQILTVVLFIVCALVLSGCGSNETVQEQSSSRTVAASAAETERGDEEAVPVGSASGLVAERPADADAGALAGGADDQTEMPGHTAAGAMSDTGALTAAAPLQQSAAESYDDSSLDETYPQRISPAGLSVTRAYICRGIEESEPTDAGRSFLPKEDGLNRLCCFSEITGSAGPDSIWHVWYWGDREMGRGGLEVKGARWRTWSRKQVLDEWKGEWHVDIVDASDFLLYRLEFSIE